MRDPALENDARRAEVFNALATEYNKLRKRVNPPRGYRPSEWAMTKSERMIRLRQLLLDNAKPGWVAPWLKPNP